jgi:hypothetical protein
VTLLQSPASRLVPLALACAMLEHGAGADAPAPGAPVPIFTIAKSENKNQVQYVIRLDDHCAPVGSAPLSGFWRMLEQGPSQTAPILPREVRAYDFASQTILRRDAAGGEVRAVLRALPGRPVTIVTSRGADGKCRAAATLSVSGTPAYLFNVYVQLKWDGVDYLLLRAWSTDGSHVVTEKVSK